MNTGWNSTVGKFGSGVLGFLFLLMVEHSGAWSQVGPGLCTGIHGNREASRCSSELVREIVCVGVGV